LLGIVEALFEIAIGQFGKAIERDDNNVVPFLGWSHERSLFVAAFGMDYGFWLYCVGGICDLAGGNALGEAVAIWFVAVDWRRRFRECLSMDDYETENSAESEDRDYLDGVSKLMMSEWDCEPFEPDEIHYYELIVTQESPQNGWQNFLGKLRTRLFLKRSP
jgi:hypothetical protein